MDTALKPLETNIMFIWNENMVALFLCYFTSSTHIALTRKLEQITCLLSIKVHALHVTVATLSTTPILASQSSPFQPHYTMSTSSSGPPVDPAVSETVLSKTEILNLLLKLDHLLQNLPESLPLPQKDNSCYGKLLSFHPLPSDWLECIGPVGTVNRQLEVVFGTRAFGFKLKERGPILARVVPILRQYLFEFPTDIILQKWLLDLVRAASEAHTSIGAGMSSKVSASCFLKLSVLICV